LAKWLGKRKEAFIESQGKVVALVEYENKSVKCQNLHQLLAKMSAMLGTLIAYLKIMMNLPLILVKYRHTQVLEEQN
jgi:hypothetical protein